MFRKIYKQANDDIKPSEDMINRVILNAHKGAEKRQSPLPYRRYAKYAVSAAAAVVVVSAAVISMPYWQKTRDDGVIIEEQVSTPTPSDMSESVVSNTADTSYPLFGSLPRSRLASSATGGASAIAPLSRLRRQLPQRGSQGAGAAILRPPAYRSVRQCGPLWALCR